MNRLLRAVAGAVTALTALCALAATAVTGDPTGLAPVGAPGSSTAALSRSDGPVISVFNTSWGDCRIGPSNPCDGRTGM
ncbi:hypothetical protein P3T27_005182 [Kitasatospora sp. MAA19]|uniref:hypothetical protein n=1 Tax=unclassified Kitasatospora TaxID=2633591 RepID=UPI0024761E00|nr:hypothetical protein [Kitasatospora sp. MAA19]MDH6708442.1 hypothetical protein [Kitasatospora sp. MAA19]